LIGLLLLGASLPTRAQSSSSSAPSATQSSSPGEPPPPQTGPTADSYVVSLSTGEIMNVPGDGDAVTAGSSQPPLALTEYADGLRSKSGNGDFRSQLSYGLSLAAAYSNDYSGAGTASQVYGTMRPYVGFILPTRTGSLVAQYSAVINPHEANVRGQGPHAYHEFSLTARGAFTRRWSWKLVGSGGYGSEALRVEEPLTFSVVQSIPVLNVSSTVLLPATNVLLVASTARLYFQKNERNWFSFTLDHTYTGIDGDPNNAALPSEHSNTAGLRVDYTHLVSTRLSIHTYGEEQTLFVSPLCYSYGGGFGLSANLSHAVSVDVEGGPQFTHGVCGSEKSANFKAVITGHLNRRDRVYATASRIFASAYQVHGTWQDAVAVGFSKSLGICTFATDAGFLRETIIGTPAYQGYFVVPRLHIKLFTSLGFTAGYRTLWVTGGGLPSGALNFASVSLDWYPAGLRLK
jgi:hypothetical protein